MNPYDLIHLHENTFTKSDNIIKESILENPQIIIKYNIITASRSMDVSKSALLRFCKKLGYNGFSDFKYDLSRYIHSGGLDHFNEESAISDVTKIMMNAISELGNYVTPQIFEDLAADICNSNNIRIIGYQSTGTSCTQLMYRLMKVGIISYAFNNAYILGELEELAKPGDLHIYFSMSASSFNDIPNEISKSNAKTILITQNNTIIRNNFFNKIIILPALEKSAQDYFIESQYLTFIFIELLIIEVSKYIESKMAKNQNKQKR